MPAAVASAMMPTADRQSAELDTSYTVKSTRATGAALSECLSNAAGAESARAQAVPASAGENNQLPLLHLEARALRPPLRGFDTEKRGKPDARG